VATGLKPREFVWVISGKLAVAERIGGHGFQHRRVRREEEISWLQEAGVTTVLSLLPGNQNLASYEDAGLEVIHEPIETDVTRADVDRVFKALSSTLESGDRVVLVHRDHLDDEVAGLLAGFLVHSRLIEDPIVAAAVIQEIIGRPIGPEGRALIPG
jgi:hypothetical protein